jgi:hypothetical protein
MNEKQEAQMLECIVDIKDSLHQLSDCTYTGINGGVFFRLAGDPLNIKVNGIEGLVKNGVTEFVAQLNKLEEEL